MAKLRARVGGPVFCLTGYIGDDVYDALAVITLRWTGGGMNDAASQRAKDSTNEFLAISRTSRHTQLNVEGLSAAKQKRYKY